jgi:3-isopropylmalate/(R)-2-methylmalate dehydratase large subunit
MLTIGELLMLTKQKKIVGKALIFWDPEHPGKKRDGIDTDQITPSSYCVSESLETLDAKWKEGAFKYLMPDFREKVHQGHTFVIAGDRFGIGSSREMSPAGLKAIAEEAGLEMVIVCGNNMGDIFRRNALNLGLHVCQSPEAVADARDEDVFEFDPTTRTLRNLTQNKSYTPIPLTKKEEEIRRSGGVFSLGKKELALQNGEPATIEFPDEKLVQSMTVTEQIIWAHRVDKEKKVRPGETLRVYADLLPASDGTAPFAIYTFNQITGGESHPKHCAIVNDHFVFTGIPEHESQTSISRAFALKHGINPPYYAEKGTGIFHFYLPEQGLIVPGGFYPGGDSHSRAYGAYGAVGIGVGSTTIGFGWALGYIYFTCAKQRKVIFTGKLQPWVTGKDVVLSLLQKWGKSQAQGMSVEFVDENKQLPMAYRNTIANMMAEGEALNGIFPQDEITEAWFKKKKIPLVYPKLSSGANAHYEIVEELNLSNIQPMIAKPFSPSNAFPAEEIAKERVTFSKAYIGSCTNGGYEDLFQAALVFYLARKKGIKKIPSHIDFAVYPGSGTIKKFIEQPDPRLNGESIAEVFRSVGGKIRDSWCGPCFGQGEDALKEGEVAITSFNRNWQNRMGKGGLGYLASPMVVASSALCGYMAPPSEIGILWEPHLFDI